MLAKMHIHKRIESYLNTDDANIERLKTNGKELYNKEFSMQTCASKYDALYHSIIKKFDNLFSQS